MRLQKGIGSSSQELEVFTKQNESADIPAHDEHADRDTNKGSTDRVDITEVFEPGTNPPRMYP